MSYRICVLSALAVLQLGCSPDSPQASFNPVRQFQLLGRYYGGYLSANRGKAPSSESDFKEFLNGRLTEIDSRGYSSIEQFLVSPRDGKNLVVLYGKEIIDDGPGGLPWVAHEQTGIDGRRFAIGARGVASELGPAEFTSIFGKGE